MAISITSPANANISDTLTSLSVSYTGGLSGGYNIIYLRINGTTVLNVTSAATTGSVTFTPVNVKSSIWAYAAGSSLSNCVTILAQSFDSAELLKSSASKTGSLTINTRLTNFTNNGANVNLDGSSYIKGSWTNPNTSYFRGNFRAYVDGNVVASASQQNTFYDRTVASGDAWYTAFNNAIGSSTSKTITYTLTTQFNTGSWGDIGGSVGSYTGSLTKTQYTKGTLSSLSDYTVASGLTVSYNGADGGGGSGITYSLELKIGSTVVAARTNLSSVGSSMSITEDEKNAMFSTLAGSASATTTLALATYINGSWYGESTASATVYNVIATITSYTNTERSGTSLSFSYSTNTSVDMSDYKIGDGTWVAIKSNEDHTSGVFTVPDLSPSTTYTVYLRVRHATSEQYTTSSGLSVTTVNTSVISNTPNFDINTSGVSIPLEISKVNVNMRHTVTLKNVAETVTYGTSAANIDTTGTIVLSSQAITDLHAATSTVKTLDLVLVCESLLSGVSQGFTRKTIVATVVNSNPSITNAIYSDINSTVQAILGDNQKILQNLSTLRVTGYGMASYNSATLSSLVINFGGNEYSVSISGTSVSSAILDVGTLNVPESGTASVFVIDSRGYASAAYQMPISMIAYNSPFFTTYELTRRNNYYDDAYVYANYQINSVITNSIQRNSVAVQYRYKLSSSSTWSSWESVTNPTPSIDGVYLKYAVDNEHASPPVPVNYTFGINNVYNVEFRISDTFTTTPVVFSSYIPKGMGHIEFYENRVNFGVQPYYTNLASEEKEIYHEDNIGSVISATMQAIYPVGSIYLSTSSTNPATLFGFGTWEAFAQGRTIVGVGTSDAEYPSGSTGGESTHTLTVEEMPQHTHIQDSHNHIQNSHTHSGSTGEAGGHTHTINWDYDGAGGSTRYTVSNNAPHGGTHETSWAGQHSHSVSIANATATNQAATAVNQNTGGGLAHNNMQPYIVTYVWQRTA